MKITSYGPEMQDRVSLWRHPEAGRQGGGARQKMAFLRCRRDPCGVICLILTYFSVFYADYVVIQYVLIPAFADRSVFRLFVVVWSFKKPTWRLFLCGVSIHLTACRSDSILTLCLSERDRCQTCFLWHRQTLKHVCLCVCLCKGFIERWLVGFVRFVC